MTLKQLQEQIAGLLNADELLRQGGCRAFAEDTHDVLADVGTHLQQAGGVALVVLTPSAERNGFSPRGLPARLCGGQFVCKTIAGGLSFLNNCRKPDARN